MYDAEEIRSKKDLCIAYLCSRGELIPLVSITN